MTLANIAGLDLSSPQGIVVTAVFAICGAYLLRSYLFTENEKPLAPPPVTKAPIVKNRNIVKKLQEVGSKVVIFFGSQTGTAEDFSGRLAKEAKQRFGVNCLVADIDDYDMDQLDTIPSDYLAIFVMATYGEGEPTDNASDFYHMFIDQTDAPWSEGLTDVSDSPLKNLRYFIFGLGNRTYEHFNLTATKVDESLTKFGAKRFYELGLGDDDGSLEDDFIQWKDPMWKSFCEALNIDFENSSSQKVQATLAISEVSESNGDVYRGQLVDPNAKVIPGAPVTYDAKNPFYAPVKITRELFADNCGRNCIHLELDISGTNITYDTGDHVGVWATNPESLVLLTAKAFGLSDKLDQVITAMNTDPTASKKYPFPVPTTYHTMLRHYVDICAAPSRQFLTQLVSLVKSDVAKNYLDSISSDLDPYTKNVTNHRLTMAEIVLQIQELEKNTPQSDRTVIPLDLVIENLGRIMPRYYSISSSGKVHPKNVHVTASVLEFSPNEKPDRKVHGLFTNYLLGVHNRLTNNDQLTHQYHLEPQTDQSILTIPMFIRKSNFSLPKSSKVPVIMVGPGTGVAPFRGFVQERAYLAQQGQDVGPTVLYFGCRKRDEDFLYSDEWEPLFNSLPNAESKMINAFSREQTEKVYVQHLLKKDSESIWKLVNDQNAYIYVCGDAKHMAKDVTHTLVEIAQEYGQLTEQHAVNYVKKLRSQNRYQEDVWA